MKPMLLQVLNQIIKALLFICSFIFWLANFSIASGSEARPQGDWPMWRHDARLTGYQPLPGAMKRAPEVLAKYSLGAGPGAATWADLSGKGQAHEILMVARGHLSAYDEKGKRLWECVPQGYVLSKVEWVEDLDGDGQNEVVALAGHMGITRQAYLILDGRTGDQKAAIDINTGDFSWRGHCGAYVPGQKGKQVLIITSMRQSQSGPAASEGQVELSFQHSGIRSLEFT